jgi:colicin import membrane protein
MTLVATGGDRFVDLSSATGPVGSGFRRVISAALGSLLLHGLVSLGFGSLHAASAPVAAPTAIPIEIMVETGPPATRKPARAPPPVEANAAAMLDVETAPPGGVGSTAPGLASPQAATTPARRPRSLGLEQEPVRAVPVPEPVDRGDEPMRYDVAVLGQLERVKQFPERAALRRARGTAVVGFALDATGRVLVASILRSSGDRDLDLESLAVIRRAAPFPAPPPGARRQFAVDVAFGSGG